VGKATRVYAVIKVGRTTAELSFGVPGNIRSSRPPLSLILTVCYAEKVGTSSVPSFCYALPSFPTYLPPS